MVIGDQNLQEVVVIGYGTVKKTDATGSVIAVSSKDFNKGAITSPQDLLVGKSAGVVITLLQAVRRAAVQQSVSAAVHH